jgi:hypothetical protein
MISDEIKLDPCPFCGEVPTCRTGQMMKHTCGAFGDAWTTIDEWSVRPIEDELRQQIATLTEKMESNYLGYQKEVIELANKVSEILDNYKKSLQENIELTEQLKAAEEDADRLANSLEPMSYIFAEEPSATSGEYFERGLSMKKATVRIMQAAYWQHEARKQG